MGNNKKNGGGNKKQKKTDAEVAADSTPGWKDLSGNRNVSPALGEEKKPKDAVEAPGVIVPSSEIKGTEVTLIIPDEDLNKPLYLIDDSGNKVQVGFHPLQAGVQNSSSRRNDDTKNSYPSGVQPGQSPFPKSPELKKIGVSTSDGRADDNSQKRTQKASIPAEVRAELIGTKCKYCNVKQSTENMLRAYGCEHYFCWICLSAHTLLLLMYKGTEYDPAAQGCPVEECPKHLSS